MGELWDAIEWRSTRYESFGFLSDCMLQFPTVLIFGNEYYLQTAVTLCT
jgi:hypothetical protein